MEACSPIVARYTGAAQDCAYEVAWANTWQVGIDYTAAATRCGNAVLNRHRAPASRHLRLLGAVPNLRAAAFRHSATEIGVEGLAVVATSTTSATTLAGLSFNGRDGITPAARGLVLDAQRGLAFVVDTTVAKEFALARWLVGGADGGRLFVHCFDAAMTVSENIAGDVLASLTTMHWNSPSKAWTGCGVGAQIGWRVCLPCNATWPNSAARPRRAFASMVRCFTTSARAACRASTPCCSAPLTGTGRISCRRAASTGAAASAAPSE
jgi:hypothetical protein